MTGAHSVCNFGLERWLAFQSCLRLKILSQTPRLGCLQIIRKRKGRGLPLHLSPASVFGRTHYSNCPGGLCGHDFRSHMHILAACRSATRTRGSSPARNWLGNGHWSWGQGAGWLAWVRISFCIFLFSCKILLRDTSLVPRESICKVLGGYQVKMNVVRVDNKRQSPSKRPFRA